MDRRSSLLKRLSLTVRTNVAPDRAAELRRLVEERFMQEVLDACDRAVHRRLGDETLVFVRRLDARWSIERARLDDAGALNALGEELAELVVARVENAPPEERLRPPPSRGMVAFRGEGHLRASALVEHVRGEPTAWFHGSLADESDLWLGACQAGPLVLRETLEWLVRMDAATVVVESLTAGQRAQALAVLPAESWPAGVRAPKLSPSSPGAVAEPMTPREGRMGIPAGEEAVAAHGGESAQPSEPARVEASETPPEPAEPVRAETAPAENAHPENVRAENARTENVRVEPARAAEAPAPAPDAIVPAEIESVVESAAPDAPAAKLDEDEVETGFAGLFYLAGRVLELELAESLYYAGAREGQFLVHVARALAGPDGAEDPAARLFGGCPPHAPDPPFDALPRWATDEVWKNTVRHLGERLATLDAAPPPRIETAVDHLAAGLSLPRSATPRDPLTAHLARRAAAALALWFCARLGEPPSIDTVRARLAIPGRVHFEEDLLRVRVPMKAVDLDLRLAGLDFDPGWIPWLGRKLVFEFVPDTYRGEIA
jgi:hypothetical protein